MNIPIRYCVRLFKRSIAIAVFWSFITYVCVVFDVFGYNNQKVVTIVVNGGSKVSQMEELLQFHTGFYYKTSTFYANNTAVLIYLADHRQNSKEWTCSSSNMTSTMESNAIISRATNFSEHCYWMTHIARCLTVDNPTAFRLTVLNATESITIPLERPDRKPRGVVSCFAPMFFEQRWQTIAMIHEMNAAWGVELQVHYVQSAVGDTLELLQPFVDRGLLEIRALDIPDLGIELTKKFGYNPAQATEARHQVISHQDCFFRYRESAEFIIITDPDEPLIPTHGNTIYSELKHWKRIRPFASAFMFPRKIAYAVTSEKIDNFSLQDTVRSIQITDLEVVGKSVYNPRYTETPWIHWPGLNVTNVFNIPSSSCLLHVDYSYDRPHNITSFTRKLSDVVDLSVFNNTVINYAETAKTLRDLPDHTVDYAIAIGTCKKRLHILYQYPRMSTVSLPCTTATSCEMPIRHINCTMTLRQYRKECILYNRLCAILPNKVQADFFKGTKGCAWGNLDHYGKQ
uniref:Glycosyltransferase family 92 protein n=1 Tax=Panagrellus redivivus TaxID=6233 RepID=A0A7E4VEL6_PANRE